MEVDVIFKIAAVGLIVAILNHILSRSQKEEYTMITTIAGLIIVLMMLLPGIDELFKYIRSVFNI
ncbi:MAG: stage III sporulation protein AC [Clostridiales bacterium]|jgi:stage III sporulation protein AC|nr:stage III sporulation protein AC [Clostridiales bacterium]HOA34251.1 stage III sporulation protein AC [Clostridiales bacterium]HOJ36098.1 stage III sporulation protein AC [Clostridiales bacterium]HOL79532.1 stage III sporulation protein AC [Clostridiales bacterium]HPP67619.1 stage III sporulation protein AC [Clostridiales bacterium]